MSNSGSNNYNALELVPNEEIVSRTLQSKNRFWTNIIWRPGKPALDSEWNLLSDATFESISNLIKSTSQSGWLDLGSNVYSDHSYMPNNFQFYSNSKNLVLDIPNAIVNGWPIIVGGVNYTDTSINSIFLDDVDEILGSQRYDFVFLEVWRAQIRSRDPNNNKIAQNKPSLTEIYAYGNLQYGGQHFEDDIVDSAIKPSTDGIETSERIQIQYKIRTVKNVSFVNCLSSGFEDIMKVQGQGANLNPQISNYEFINMKDELNDAGLWRCGNGDNASRSALRSVDGYSYAIPMFKIYRRAKVFYNDTGVTVSDAYDNQQANFTKLEDLVSDRPDGKFCDMIDDSDILDLRLKVSLNGYNYDEILEKNLHYLLMGNLESVKKTILQYDLISDSNVNGYTNFSNNLGCNGKRSIWSDSVSDQTNIFAKVSTTSTSSLLDVYVVKLPGVNWRIGDQIIIQSAIKLPSGTIIKATPKIYVEEKVFGSNITELIPGTDGHWTGLSTSTAVFTFDVNKSHNKNLWVYYDITIPVGQGISYVPNELSKIKYINHTAYSSGSVIRGEILFSNINDNKQNLANHVFENVSNSVTFKEVEFLKERKQVIIKPLIQTTDTKDGLVRTLDVKTTNVSAKQLYVPFEIQHLRGVYTHESGGTEIATQSVINVPVSDVDISENTILVSENYYIADITSFKFDSTGSFFGSEIELIGTYKPVYTHKRTSGSLIGSFVKFYDSFGNIFDIPSGMTSANFKWTGRKIRSRGGAGYGYDINGQQIDCSVSDNNGLFSGFTDGQQLWVDMDYLGTPHQGAEVRIIYEHTPYQGFDVGGQTIQLVHKRDKGLFFNNGTGGNNVDISVNGTSNFLYTPVSSKFPGSFQDFLRDGQFIDIASKGIKRFNSDIWFNASYDCYGYNGGGFIWINSYVMPNNPQTTSRGFLSNPMLEVIFELPTVDQDNAEFVLILLVKNKQTDELYLLVQIGNHGDHTSGFVHLELYRLNEKLLVR